MTQNTSDMIEAYIKTLLAQSGCAEMKRSHLADTFQVVPSQINYVIKTRFTESRGYLVESKRGGGGYIRIARQSFSDNHHMLESLRCSVGTSVSYSLLTDILQHLFEEGVLTRREGSLLLAVTTDDVLGDEAAVLRATMLRQLLQRLDRKG